MSSGIQRRPGQPGGRRDTNRREKVKALLDAALPLFLERGIEAVSIDDITKAAGVAKGSFYRYFDDKPALVTGLFEETNARLRAAFRASGDALAKARTRAELVAGYEVLGRALAAIVFEHGEVVKLYLQECRGPALGARVPIRAIATMILQESVRHTEKARAHGLLRPLRAELSALSVIGAVERLLFALLSGEEMGPPDEVPAALISLVLDGLRAPDAAAR
jgi:AcrR family transcriptional regulator